MDQPTLFVITKNVDLAKKLMDKRVELVYSGPSFWAFVNDGNEKYDDYPDTKYTNKMFFDIRDK